MRRTLAAAAAVVTAALGGLILGEYELGGWIGLAAGPVVGFLVAEVVVTAGRWSGWGAAALAAVLGAASMAGAGWIDSDGGVEPYPGMALAGAALAAAVAAARARPEAGAVPDRAG